VDFSAAIRTATCVILVTPPVGKDQKKGQRTPLELSGDIACAAREGSASSILHRSAPSSMKYERDDG